MVRSWKICGGNFAPAFALPGLCAGPNHFAPLRYLRFPLKTIIPLGKLIAVGGNEDKGTYPNPRTRRKYYLNFFELGILKRIVLETGKLDPRIEVVTTASARRSPAMIVPRYQVSHSDGAGSWPWMLNHQVMTSP